MADVTVVRPESDQVENALSGWAGLVLTAVSGAIHVSVTDIRGSTVTRVAVENKLGNSDATIFFGHGGPDRLGNPAVIDSANVSKASNRVLISIACSAAAILGRDAVSSHGVKASLGFDDILVSILTRPSVFGDIVEQAITPFLLSGASVDDMKYALIMGFQRVESIHRAITTQDAAIIWMAARINWRGIVSLGDNSATIS